MRRVWVPERYWLTTGRVVSHYLSGTQTRLQEIPGLVPSLKRKLDGCVFASRCAYATDLCRTVAPGLEEKAPGHIAACHYAIKDAVAA